MSTHNLHVPLPEDLYLNLRAEAQRSGEPATELAREGILMLLSDRRRQVLRQEIEVYAASVAGTQEDLDQELEAASVEYLSARKAAR